MKRIVAAFVVVVVAAALAASLLRSRDAPSPQGGHAAAANPQHRFDETVQQPAAPEVTLRLNGVSRRADPLVLTAGEPVLAEVQLRHPDPLAKESIRLEPSSGSWAGRVKIVVTNAKGASAPWRFAITGKPSTGGLALQPGAVTTLVLRVEPDARTSIAPGRYTLAARLDLMDGRGFRGTADSEAVDVNVITPLAPTVGAEFGRRQLLRVRDALLGGDMSAAETAATEMQRAEPRRPEGFVGMALVQEARGELNAAVLSAELAISRAMGDSGEKSTELNSVARLAPLEYYELLDRLEAKAAAQTPQLR